MLILVGVTVNVALNGGLFETANKAVKQTQKEADREILQAAVIAALNEQLKIENAQAIKNNLPDGWEVTGAEGGPYTCTSPKENVFIVDQNGEITIAWVDNGNGTFTKGDTTVEKEKTYTNAQFEELLKELGIIEKYTGDYKGDWQVIGLEGGKLKLVSTENVNSGNVILGYDDKNVYKKDPEGNITTELKDDIVDLNGDGNYYNFEKAVWSYTHAVDTLDEVAQKATKIESARSITIKDIYGIIGGEENVDKGSSYGTVYNYYFETSNSTVCSKKKTGTDENGEEQWGSASTSYYASQTFVDSEGRTVTIDANNPNASVKLPYDYFSYTLTDAQKSAIGSLKEGYYWLASPCVSCEPDGARFHVRCMNSGSIYSNYLFYSDGNADNGSNGVRAVVSI